MNRIIKNYFTFYILGEDEKISNGLKGSYGEELFVNLLKYFGAVIIRMMM